MVLNDKTNYHLAAIYGFGNLLLLLALVHTAIPTAPGYGTIDNVIEFLFLGGPALGVIGVGYRATTTTIDDDLFETLTYWSIGGALSLFLIGSLLVFYFGEPLWTPTALFMYHIGAAFGAFGGSFVGLHEARAVTRAREIDLTQEQRDRLEHLNHLLRHDLLNDLHVITGSVELAIEDADGEVLDRLETIRRQSEQATELIQNVRVLVQASRKDQPLEPVNLTDIIETEFDHLRDTYPEATLTADIPPEVSVRADDLLASVFGNIVRNAIQHNDADTPQVSVTADAGEESVTVSITDNGPGIPPDLRDDLFEPSEEGDHGFGMYLVRTLVSRYDGTVAIADTGPDGTAITVELTRA